ncbi:MAG: DUF4129 domain-containing protein, partial [Gammaproteobacteria bacterium]|nr:DUF4129 domain-containing protein [Gammaproteobacteria bacterium]
LASWLCLAGPLFVLLWVVMPGHPVWAMFIVWWFKPVYERIPLRILASAIFGVTPSLKDALGEWRAAIVPGIVHALSYRRLSPMRSFEAPVWVLEGLAGPGRQKRLAILQARAGSGAFWLTVLGAHIEAFLVLGLVTGVYLLIPSEVEIDWWGLLVSGSQGDQDWLLNLLYLLAMAAVAPVYVGAGFALYLNRRVELEAWDIELGFRRLAQRASAAVLVFVFAGLFSPGSGLRAQELSNEVDWQGPDPVMEVLSPRRQGSRDEISDVLLGRDFNQQSVVRYPKFLEGLFETEDPPPSEDLWAGLRFVAWIAEVALWAGVIALVAWLLYRSRLLEVVTAVRRKRTTRPDEIVGVALSADGLPDDVAGTARRIWNEGVKREALGLIYRAALGSLIHRYHCQLNAADTERECLDKARSVLSEAGASYLGRLTRAWQFAAYAHALPDNAQFAELCDGWSEVFEVGQTDES